MSALGVVSVLLVLGSITVKASNQSNRSPDKPNTITITPELIGQIGGPTNAIAWQEHYVYVGAGPRLLIMDVSNPAQPVVTGQTEWLPEVVSGLAVAGNYTYVADGYSGLRVIDVSNPTAPAEVGFCNTSGGAYNIVVVSGNYAYVIDELGGVQIIDISDPTAPTKVGGYNTSGYAYGEAVVGKYAYITTAYLGLRVIDVSNPTAPLEVGYYDPGYPYTISNSIEVVGDYAYIAYNWHVPGLFMPEGLLIIDISDPFNPKKLGSYLTSDYLLDIAVTGSYAYVTEGESGLHILDISNPSAPQEIGLYDPPSFIIDVSGNYAYVTGASSGIHIINISNPTALLEVGSYIVPKNAVDVSVVGNYAYIAGGSGLHIVDKSSPTAPREVGFYDTPGGANDVAVAGKYAYIADDIYGLHIIDISNLLVPQEVGGIPCWANDVAIEGYYAYVADQKGLRIIDISDPASPSVTGFIDTIGYATGVFVAGNRAYLASDYGLRIVDISKPANPVEIGSTQRYPISGVDVVGNYAYIAVGNGLRIIDVSDPAFPKEIGSYYLIGAVNVTVAGKYAYVAAASSGLHIIDISHPAAPFEAGFFDTPGTASSMVGSGNYIYVADGHGGLVILRLLTDKITVPIPLAGGSLDSTDGSTNLIFPSGAFTQTVNLTYRQLLYDEHIGYWAGIGHTFDISGVYSDAGAAANLAPGQTFTMTMTYSDTEIGAAIEYTLAFYNWDDTRWVKEATSIVDIVNNHITATSSHLSLWAVLGETNRSYFPVIGR